MQPDDEAEIAGGGLGSPADAAARPGLSVVTGVPAVRGASDLQALIDATPAGDTLLLAPREYRGPATIARPLTIEGRGATLWALAGPVLQVTTPGVRLVALHIEVTDPLLPPESAEAVALTTTAALEISDVRVRGTVQGLAGAEGAWLIPHTLQLGALPAMTPFTLAFEIEVPAPCQLSSGISSLDIRPAGTVLPGRHIVRLMAEAMPADVLLNGSITIEAAGLRRAISVSGHVVRPDDGWVPLPEATRLLWRPPAPPLPIAPPIALPVPLPAALPVHPPAALPVTPPESKTVPPPPSPTPPRVRMVMTGDVPLGRLFSDPAPQAEPPRAPQTRSADVAAVPIQPPPPTPPSVPRTPDKPILGGMFAPKPHEPEP